MKLFPELTLGWLNGWLMLATLYTMFGAMLLAFPREVVERLYDRSGWSQAEQRVIAIGKLASFAWLGLVIFTPLGIGEPVFIVGSVLCACGLVGIMVALINYRDAPLDRPISGGLYRVSRNPQVVAFSVAFLGVSVAIGSWTAVFLLVVATFFSHLRVLAEERTCLDQYGESFQQYMDCVPRYLLVI